MDIQEWLQNTAYREPPEEPSFSDVSHPQLSVTKPTHILSHRHKDEGDRRGRGRDKRARSSSSDHVRLVQKEAAESCSNHNYHHEGSSASSRERVPIKSYEKRARHKTRPDRYERKPAKKKKEQEPDREKKSKSKRRKGHRSGDGARTSGLVQSFQLKNGPKNNRLTLRPEASAGIFHHGKASAPMAASGPGLPDLAFNEMRFLSRPRNLEKGPPNESAQPTKKSRKELREEEISSYFRNVAAERRTGEQDQHEQISGMPMQVQPTIESAAQMVEQVDRETHARAPIELPENSFLGFGSRGVPQQRQDLQSTSRSYYTWSESVHQPRRASPDEGRPVPPRPPSRNARGTQQKRQSSHVSTMSLPQRRDYDHQERHFDHGGTRNQGCPSDNPEHKIQHHGLPQERRRGRVNEHAPYLESALGSVTSVPRGVRREVNEFHVFGDNRPREADRHHTSDILKLRDVSHFRERSLSLPRTIQSSHLSVDQENVDPIASTPTSKLLRNAWEAVSRPQQYHQPSSTRRSSGLRHCDVAEPHPEVMIIQSKNQHFERTSNDEHHQPRLADRPGEHMPQRGFNRAGEHPISQHRQSLRSASATTSNSHSYLQRSTLAPLIGRQVQQWPDHDEMQDYAPEETRSAIVNSKVYANSRQAEELVRHLAFDKVPDLYGQTQRASDIQSTQHEVGDHGHISPNVDTVGGHNLELRRGLDHQFFTEPPSMQMEASDQEYQTGRSYGGPAVEQAPSNDLAGFWKPNILY